MYIEIVRAVLNNFGQQSRIMGALLDDEDHQFQLSLGDGIVWEISPPNGFYFNMGDPVKLAKLRELLMQQGLQTTIYCHIHEGCLYYTPTDPTFVPNSSPINQHFDSDFNAALMFSN